MNVDIEFCNYYGSDVANHFLSPVQQMRWMLSKKRKCGFDNEDRYYVRYSESKYRLRISLTHPRDCHFAHVQ